MSLQKLVFVGLLTFSALSYASAIRPASLGKGSQFLIHLNNEELLKNRKQIWEFQQEGFIERCVLKIDSHYDEFLVSDAPVIYSLNQIQTQSSLLLRSGVVRDEFTYQLITENKNLPLLRLNCFMQTPINSEKPKWFTLEEVEILLGQSQFFSQPLIGPNLLTAIELAPPARVVRTLVPLHFSSKGSGKTATAVVPSFQAGKIVEKPEPGAFCTAHYQSEVTDFKTFELTLLADENFEIEYLTEMFGFYNIVLRSFTGSFSLTIQCFTQKKGFNSFSEIRTLFHSIFEFKSAGISKVCPCHSIETKMPSLYLARRVKNCDG